MNHAFGNEIRVREESEHQVFLANYLWRCALEGPAIGSALESARKLRGTDSVLAPRDLRGRPGIGPA